MCLLRCYTGPQQSQSPYRVIAAASKKVVALDLLLIHYRHPEVRPDEEVDAVKVRRCDTDDREGMLVELDGGSQYTGVGMEAVAPESIAEHDVRCGIRPVLVALMEEAAELRSHAEHIEVVAGDFVIPSFLSRPANADSGRIEPVRCHVAESRVPHAVIQVIRI